MALDTTVYVKTNSKLKKEIIKKHKQFKIGLHSELFT